MTTVCVGDGFEVDENGLLTLNLLSGCNAMAVSAAGVGVPGVDRFDAFPRFGDDSFVIATAGASGPFTTVGTTGFVGLAPGIDTAIQNPSSCRDMMYMGISGHFMNWYTGDSGAGRFVLADIIYIDGVPGAALAGEHSLSTGLGNASLSTTNILGPFLLPPGGSVLLSIQPAWRAEGAITAASVISLSYGMKAVGFFV